MVEKKGHSLLRMLLFYRQIVLLKLFKRPEGPRINFLDARTLTSLELLDGIRKNVGTELAQWLRYFVTNKKVVGSTPFVVMDIFIDINPSDLTMALGSIQPLTEMSTRSISWGKCGRCIRLTNL
jgi:hypothetical protein